MNHQTTDGQVDNKHQAVVPSGHEDTARQKRSRWTANWSDLVGEVTLADICTGCSGCVVACPKDVLSLDTLWHPRLSRGAWQEGNASKCIHGERGCTMCTRACPRFRAWEPQADIRLHGRRRAPEESEEVAGIQQSIKLVKATDPEITRAGQDGGLVSALIIYCLEQGYIDAALVSYTDDQWNTRPGVARSREEVLQAAGSRYTYSANLAAYTEAVEGGADRIALVGVGCQTSVPPIMMERGVRRAGKRFALNIGLLCTKTFTESFFDQLLGDKYGLSRHDILGMNIKGALQLHLRAGINEDNFLEIPLKECHPFTRPGCTTCPDFSAQHADISVGGIGTIDDRTLAIVRTDFGARLIDEMTEARLIDVATATEVDPTAVKLLRILSRASRKRWPVTVESGQPVDHAVPGHLPAKPVARVPARA